MLRQPHGGTFLTLAMLSMLTFASGSASADIMTTLGIGNTAVAGFPGPYVQVEAQVVGGVAKFALTGLTKTGGGNTFDYWMGDGGIFSFNVSGSTNGLAIHITSDPDKLKTVLFDQNISTFGVFDVALKWFGGAAGALRFLSFDVTRPGGFAGDSDIFVANAEGNHYASHVFVKANGELVDAVCTGFASDGDQVVPEPAAIALFGTVLILLARQLAKKSARGI